MKAQILLAVELMKRKGIYIKEEEKKKKMAILLTTTKRPGFIFPSVHFPP